MFHLCLPLLVAGCVSAPRLDPVVDRGKPFSARAFFEGRTVGEGTLREAFSAPRHTHVEGFGRPDGADAIVLDQTVQVGAKPATRREWRITRTSPGRYMGTLTSAAGPIEGDVSGDRLHLRFRTKRGLDTEQWLTLAPDRQSAHNIMEVRKDGLLVGTLDEEIRKERPVRTP